MNSRSRTPSQTTRHACISGAALVLSTLLVTVCPAAAQPKGSASSLLLSSAERALLCGPRATTTAVGRKLRLIGSDEGPHRRLFSPSETLVVGGGVADGLSSGQLFVVRRRSRRQMQPPELDKLNLGLTGIRTLGVVRIVEVDADLSSAEVLEMCEGFVDGDYLEPFEAPRVPAAVPGDSPSDYTDPGIVLFGDPGRRIAGSGDLVLVNRGSTVVVPGQVVTFYRPALDGRGPLREIATGMVMDVGASTSMVRITDARHAVFSGDRVAPHTLP